MTVPDYRLRVVLGRNSAISDKSNKTFSVLITQKSVNNDEPPPSPNIKSNGLPTESSIKSSEVSYGTDQIFSQKEIINNVTASTGSDVRLAQSGVGILSCETTG